MYEYKGVKITKYLQSGFRLDYEGLVIYIDPFKIPDNQPTASYILLTHEHFDHVDAESVRKIINQDTVLVSNKLGIDAIIKDVDISNIVETEPGEALELEGFNVETVPAYNIDKFREPGLVYHPKENQGTGFIIHLGDVALFHTGDSDNIPEYKQVKNIDVMMVPVSGTYAMTAEEAADAVNTVKPKVAIPMHHDGGVVGGDEDAQKLKELCECEIEILAAQK